jgi:hypothetical protein
MELTIIILDVSRKESNSQFGEFLNKSYLLLGGENVDQFYVGQKVRITNCTCAHGIPIGQIVTLEVANKCADGSWDLYCDDWVFDEDDCEPVD